ncbi:PRC-barrel domain-containing protein [Subtercola boreus]|uniref:Photosystem reaction center subunit H n=1 Tax=Subtercola boreus TaxID=120213 RepID=A0A3E0WDF9_9MICO|nr:PRC-barrel domain-containing protein [Subtercola boreus]RFA22857.1 photosystem reaction center subunit H [Subtercola boreus]RFA23208.1 photosystem reaction center subunit H [Subtercola boreus]RFA28958.1 photosystem reaction center subunit H [Subtercola boreus]
MFEAENVREWIGLPVVDQNGDKIGTLESLYFDTASDVPTFATVHIGILGGQKLVFVPLAGAVVAPKHLKVQYDKKLVKDAPFIATDGALDAASEPAVFAHYGLAHETGSNGERRLGRR